MYFLLFLFAEYPLSVLCVSYSLWVFFIIPNNVRSGDSFLKLHECVCAEFTYYKSECLCI